MELTNKIKDIIEPTLNSLGYHIVRVKFSGQVRPTLQVMIEKSDLSALSIDDCVKASRQTSALLDVEDPIASAYQLEVTSPGLDRPLVSLQDYIRFQGSEIKLETVVPHEGRKRFKGTLTEIKAEMVFLKSEDSEAIVEIAYSNILKAKLVPQF
ncbi:MAG: ribosome maturation factor RimP [Candidatus Paracaedimonas acanthamoebae]|uniref:Ribosome maturation factor RimP n=1 Tax=Candidatus Paracaedimonas acanthamoebae TaxID=244581 RepID=A0A8J7TV73_9PROT|nr:ribosome maturation factor RimP [Candidatus Paracaedimonas acanthamoebae]